MKLTHRADSGTHSLPKQLSWVVVGICVAPSVLGWIGIDFGLPSPYIDRSVTSGMTPDELSDAIHNTLSGSFTHTILEWTAFCTAIFTVLFAFLHFSIKGDLTTPVIGLALFFAGCMDAFHTLAADRLIHGVADNRNLIPFTWAICRLFNALILITGVGILLLKKSTEKQRNLVFIVVISLVFGCVAYIIIHFCATRAKLPNTMFPDSLVRRPYDVAPLVLFILAGVFVYPRFHRKMPSFFSHALVLSAVPEIVTQLHMAFGSEALFDSHFNIAHFLKIVAYFVPLTGLALDYLQTYREEQLAVKQLNNEIAERKRTEAELQLKHTILTTQQETALDGILVVDNERRWSSYNQRFVEMWNTPSDAVTARDSKYALRSILNMLVDPDSFLEQVEFLYEHPDEKSHEEIELVDGRTFERYSAPVRSDDRYYGRVWYYRDVTERKRAEKQIKAALKEKEILMKEIHHRVKNNLQVMDSLINLQSRTITDERVAQTLGDVRSRILSMALIHEQLYQSQDLSQIGFYQYLQHLTRSLFQTYKVQSNRIDLSIDANEIFLDIETAIPCGLIINELVSNSLKYAFPEGRNGEIRVNFQQTGNQLKLSVGDNGVGLPADIDFHSPITLGLRLVHLLTEQLDGGVYVDRSHGTRFEIAFDR